MEGLSKTIFLHDAAVVKLGNVSKHIKNSSSLQRPVFLKRRT